MSKQKPPPTPKPGEGMKKTGKVEKPSPTPKPSEGVRTRKKKR